LYITKSDYFHSEICW